MNDPISRLSILEKAGQAIDSGDYDELARTVKEIETVVEAWSQLIEPLIVFADELGKNSKYVRESIRAASVAAGEAWRRTESAPSRGRYNQFNRLLHRAADVMLKQTDALVKRDPFMAFLMACEALGRSKTPEGRCQAVEKVIQHIGAAVESNAMGVCNVMKDKSLSALWRVSDEENMLGKNLRVRFETAIKNADMKITEKLREREKWGPGGAHVPSRKEVKKFMEVRYGHNRL
jgi:hypothetical protein